MVRPLINPARARIPAESIVREDWQQGASRSEMAKLYGVSRSAIDKFLSKRISRWRRENASPLTDNERRIVVTREAFVDSAHRRIRISLPRISMHVAMLEGRP